MNILLINGSPRKNGNTEIMSDTFLQAASENGHPTEKINLYSTKVNPCLGCDYCRSHDSACVQKDGMDDIYLAMDKADLVVFASPLYSCGLSAQLVAVLNRFYSRVHTIGFHPQYSALFIDSGGPTVITPEFIEFFKKKAESNNLPSNGGMFKDGVPSPGELTNFNSAAVDQYQRVAKINRFEDLGVFAIGGMRAKGDMKNSPELQKVRDFAHSL